MKALSLSLAALALTASLPAMALDAVPTDRAFEQVSRQATAFRMGGYTLLICLDARNRIAVGGVQGIRNLEIFLVGENEQATPARWVSSNQDQTRHEFEANQRQVILTARGPTRDVRGLEQTDSTLSVGTDVIQRPLRCFVRRSGLES